VTSLTLTVLAGTSILGATAGVLGSYAVLRRRALLGDVLAHAALPGFCLAFLLMGQRHFLGMLAGALAAGLAAVAAMTFVVRWTRTKEDAAVGIVLSTFFGAGIVLSSIIQRAPGGGSKAGLETYIYGQAAAMTRHDVALIAIVAVVTAFLVALLYKEFKVFSFDPDFAQAQGWPTLTLDLAMMGLLAVVTVVGLPAVGVVLMAAMLIIPAAAARFWTDRLGRMLVVAGAIGLGTGLVGTLVSSGLLKSWLGFDPLAFGPNTRNLPTGPLIVLSGTAIFVFSLLFAPRRGLAARAWSRWRLARATAREHLLRSLYELSEPELPRSMWVPRSALARSRAWRPAAVRRLLRQAQSQGFVEQSADLVRLTETGLARAAALTRTHRLWELYLIQGAGIAPDHVDRDADSIEHFLSPDLTRRLEALLVAEGRLPAASAVPGSPHEFGTSRAEAPP
jgi:manganese/zinc/iron transport system permease protein